MAILENCMKAEIFDIVDNTLLCTSYVSQGPMESILLEVPRTIDWKEHAICRVVFYDPTLGRLTCRCSLSSPLILPDQMLSIRCEIVEKLSQEQRRNDVKVPVGVRVLLRIPHRPGDAPVPPEGWPATIVNISAGGVCLRTDFALEEGRTCSFVFPEAGGDIPLTAKVLWSADASTRPYQTLYAYGCQFVGLPSRYESQLRGFVFREERRLRNKKD